MSNKNVSKWFDQRCHNIKNPLSLRGCSSLYETKLFKNDIIKYKRLLHLKQDDIFLDVGCGNGLFLEKYENDVKESWGVDVSKEMIKIAKKSTKKTKYKIGSSFKLKFKKNYFTKVLSVWMFHYLNDEEAIKSLIEFNRVLKNNGLILISEVPMKYSLEGIEAMVGHKILDLIKIEVDTNKFVSKVPVNRYTIRRFKAIAKKSGLKLINYGYMRHTLPCLYLPKKGYLMPPQIKHMFSFLNYKVNVPFLGSSTFFLLKKEK